MQNQTNISGKEEYNVLNDTREYVQSNIINYCTSIHKNAKVYVEAKSVNGLRGFARKLYYDFLKCQVFLNRLCKSLLSGKVIKYKKYKAIKREVAEAYCKDFVLCSSSKYSTVASRVGLNNKIKNATEILGFTIKPVNEKNKTKYSLVSLDENREVMQDTNSGRVSVNE